MSNGHIDEAEIDLLLEGVPEDERKRWRYVMVGVREARSGIEDVKAVCAQRGKLCPALHLADPMETPPEPTYTRPQLVSNFWWFVGSLALAAVVGGVISGLLDKIIG